jgi:hypothetical protein
MSKKVLKVKKYTIIETEYDNGEKTMSRESEGFDALTLLGAIELTKEEIYKQITGELYVKPTRVKRKIIENVSSISKTSKKGEKKA